MNTFALEGRFSDATRFSVARNVRAGLEQGGMTWDPDHPDIIVVIGGDGSLLKSINQHRYVGNYLLINGGTLGYLGDYSISNASQAVNDILHSQPTLETHAPLVVEDRFGHYAYGANDISLIAPVRAINFDMFVNGERLSSIQGSGLVVASALGSTAFTLSLGGPILFTGDTCFDVSLVAPLNNRVIHNYFDHFVLPSDAKLKIRIEQNSKIYHVAADGTEISAIDGHDFVFYQSKVKRFNFVRYLGRSKVRRVANCFGAPKKQ